MRREFYGIEDCECGQVEFRTWVGRPEDDRLVCPTCGGMRRLKVVVEDYRSHGAGFNSRKRFTPHWNRSFGCEIESPEHMKHLQLVNGTMDFTPGRVHSDGSCDYTSRDVDTGAAEKRKKADQVLAECSAAEDTELDYNTDGSWTRTELAEDE